MLDFLFRREGDIYIVLSNQGAVGKSGSTFSNDVSLQTVAHHLREAYGDRFYVHRGMEDLVEQGALGAKTGKGL